MSGLFSRVLRLGKSEAHAVMDKFEDPIKMTEQGIRELKKDLEESMKSLAQVKGGKQKETRGGLRKQGHGVATKRPARIAGNGRGRKAGD